MTGPAGDRYREITGRVADAVNRLKQQDDQRAAELERIIVEAAERLAEAERVEAQVRESMREHWQAVAQALYEERWLKMKPMPKPDLSAPFVPAEHLERLVDQASQALADALRKRGVLRRRPND